MKTINKSYLRTFIAVLIILVVGHVLTSCDTMPTSFTVKDMETTKPTLPVPTCKVTLHSNYGDSYYIICPCDSVNVGDTYIVLKQ